MARRSHAKTRTGCATCKARRIKCKEERPECRNCIKHGVKCPGYAQVTKRTSRAAKVSRQSSELQADGESNEDVADRSDSSQSPGPSQPRLKPNEFLQDDPLRREEWPGHWHESTPSVSNDNASYHQRASWAAELAVGGARSNAGHDANAIPRLHSIPSSRVAGPTTYDELERFLLHNFTSAVQLLPSISFILEATLWHDQIQQLALRFHSARYAMLSFSATYTHFLTNNPEFLQIAILHRGRALQALQNDMRKGGKEGIDAAIASSILLADQAALEGDWKACVLHSRGLNNLCHQPGISSSIFSGTRTPDPRLRQIQTCRYDIEAITATQDGLGCYTSLCGLQTFFSKLACIDLEDTPTREFIGVVVSLSNLGYYEREIRFSCGGVAHLITLACKVHALHVKVADHVGAAEKYGHSTTHAVVMSTDLPQPTSSSSTTTSSHSERNLMRKIVELEQEGCDWLDCAPPRLITQAFDGDLPAIVLLTYRLTLDLLLHRCKLLLTPSLLPAPITVKAIRYVRDAYSIVMSEGPGYRDAEDLKLLVDCMNWPLWVLGWAEAFANRQKPFATVQASLPDQFRMHYSQQFSSFVNSPHLGEPL